jgi:hypothetical protein
MRHSDGVVAIFYLSMEEPPSAGDPSSKRSALHAVLDAEVEKAAFKLWLDKMCEEISKRVLSERLDASNRLFLMSLQVRTSSCDHE